MIFPTELSRPFAVAFLAAAMIAVIIGLDVSLFRGRTWFWERLATNVGVVLVFGAVYFRFLGRS